MQRWSCKHLESLKPRVPLHSDVTEQLNAQKGRYVDVTFALSACSRLLACMPLQAAS